MDNRRFIRRQALRWLVAAPISVGLFGCNSSGSSGRAGSGSDARVSMGLDGGLAAPPLSEAGIAIDANAAADGEMAMVDASACELTQGDAVGPFFESGAPLRMMIAERDEPGERLLIQGSLRSAANCNQALGGYGLDIWQADAAGNYFDGALSNYRLRGKLLTAPDGSFAFESVKPGSYSTTAGPRPAHLHVRVYAPNGSSVLTTQLYFAGDPYLGENDGCQPPTCHSYDPGRIIALNTVDIDGRSGLGGATNLVI